MKSSSKNFNPNRAFTLLELLVVVAIISLLAALLMPALKNARDQAKSIKCMSNLKQLGQAYAMYADDNDDAVAPSPSPPWSGAYPEWLLEPYLGIKNPYSTHAYSPVWDCPSNPSTQVAPNDRDGGLLSYTCNSDLWYYNPGLKRSTVLNPERKFLMIEHDLRFYTPRCTPNLLMQPPTGNGCGSLGHRGGMNVLFCDYHVEWLPGTHPGVGAWNLSGIYAHWSHDYP